MRHYTLSTARGVIAAAVLFAPAAMAAAGGIYLEGASVSLSELIDSDGGIQAGDKVFDDFRFVPTPGATITADDITVAAFFDEETNEAELRFVSGLLTATATGSFGPPITDFSLSFDVTITDPDFEFDYVALSAATSVEGTGIAKIAEGIQEFDTGDLSVINRKEDDLQVNFRDFDIAYVPEDQVLTKLDNVTKDVLLRVGSDPAVEDFVSMTSFSQFFGQRSQVVIPEPASLCLTAVGLIALAGRRRKQA